MPCPSRLQGGLGCDSEPGAETESLYSQRPKHRLRNAPARRQDPRVAPPLVTSHGVGTPDDPPSRLRGRLAREQKPSSDARAASVVPPSFFPARERGPRPLSHPIGSGVTLLALPPSLRSVGFTRPCLPSSGCCRWPWNFCAYLHFFPLRVQSSTPTVQFRRHEDQLLCFKIQRVRQKVRS